MKKQITGICCKCTDLNFIRVAAYFRAQVTTRGNFWLNHFKKENAVLLMQFPTLASEPLLLIKIYLEFMFTTLYFP